MPLYGPPDVTQISTKSLMPSSIFNETRISWYKLLLWALGGLVAASGALYACFPGGILGPIFSGLLTGLLVAFVQYLLSWHDHGEAEAIQRLGIRRIVPHRDDKGFYRGLLEQSRDEVLLLGNTASRFLEDFCHSSRADSCALLRALERGVRVRFLLPESQHLSAKDRARGKQAQARMLELQGAYPEKFQVRLFGHPSAHSIMKVDSQCLVGPLFPDVASKDSPAILASADSLLLLEYLKYFEREWSSGRPL